MRTPCCEQFDDFLVNKTSRIIQRSQSTYILITHIHAFTQFRLDTSKISILGSIVNRVCEGSCDQ